MYKAIPLSFIATVEHAGMRLDALLGSVFPHTGVRARRRLWNWCKICVNGKPQPHGYAIKIGDIVSIEEIKDLPSSSSSSSSSSAAAPASVTLKDSEHGTAKWSSSSFSLSQYSKKEQSLLMTFGDFILFYKPVGMHTTVISGKNTESLESLLPELWYSQQGATISHFPLPLLLTRLDYLTSGIIIAAKNEEAEKRFRQWESHGYIEKLYFSVVEGNVTKPFIIKNALDTSKRAKTRVLEKEGESTRWSRVTPLMGMDKEEVIQLPYSSWESRSSESVRKKNNSAIEATLVKVTIHRGARHQIRAHLAHAGFPLVGDPLYGKGGAPFLLHHSAVVTPEFCYQVLPDWLSNTE